MSRSKSWIRLHVAVMVSACLCVPALAQDAKTAAIEGPPPAAESDEGTDQTGPRPLEPAEIARAHEEVGSLLRTTRELLEPDETVAQIRAELPDAIARNDALSASLEDPGRLNVATVQELADQAFAWQGASRRFEAWTEELSERVGRLADARARLETERERWSLTRLSAEAQGYPATLYERIDGTLAAIDEVLSRIREERNLLLLLQDAVAAEVAHLGRGLDRLNELRDERRRRLLATEDRPLWHIRLSEVQLRTLLQEMLPLSEVRRVRLAEFGRSHEAQLSLHALILLGLIALIFGLRRYVRAWDRDDPRVSASLNLFGRPFSSSILAATLLVPSLYPEPPLVVRNVIGLIIIVPAIRILRVLVPATLHRAIYLLVPFFLLSRVIEGAPTFSPLVRLLLLVQTLAALVAMLWARRRLKLEELVVREVWRRLTRLTFHAIAVLLFASTLANVLGKVQLAQLLGTGAVRTVFLLIVVFVASRILDAIIWAALRTEAARNLSSVRRHAALIRSRSANGLRIVLVFLFVYVVLDVYDVRGPILDAVRVLLDAGVSLGALRISLGGVAAFVFTVWAAVLMSRLIRFVLSEDVMPNMALPRGVPDAVLKLAHYTVLLVGFMMAVGAAGISLDNLVLLTGAFGVGIGFGLQNVVNNFVSGLILLFERPIQVGDVVEVGALIGEVRRIGMRASAVRTWDGAEVIVPNGNLISAEVVNWTLSDRQRRVELAVGVAYGTELQRVIDLLLDVAKGHPDVLDDPAPSAIFTGFGESSVNFSLRAWTGDFDGFLRVKSDLGVAIDVALREAGIVIPFPQRDLHVRSVDDDAARALVRQSPAAD